MKVKTKANPQKMSYYLLIWERETILTCLLIICFVAFASQVRLDIVAFQIYTSSAYLFLSIDTLSSNADYE